MINAVIESKWAQFRQKALNWGNKGRTDRSIKVDSVRERSIGILQKRYGYTREEAIYQLDKHYLSAWLG